MSYRGLSGEFEGFVIQAFSTAFSSSSVSSLGALT